jgi:hypothetical protein
MSADPFIVFIISSLFTVMNYLFWGRIKRMEKDITENKNEMKQIKELSFDRLEELNETINEAERNILERIHEFEKNILTDYVRKGECEFYKDL